ncbi:MAG: O-antigen polymerase [Gammaproteobacteria bacterium]
MKSAKVVVVTLWIISVPQVLVRPLLFFLGLDDPYPPELFSGPSWDLVARAQLIHLAWILLIAATHMAFSRPMVPVARLLPRAEGTSSRKILVLAALVTTLIGAILTGLLLLRAGSVNALMYQAKVAHALAGHYVIREISVVGAIVAALAALYYEKRYRESRALRGARLMVWICVSLFVVNLAFNYFWGNRYNIAMLLIAVVLGWHYYVKRLSVVRTVLVVVVLAVVLQTLKVIRNEGVEAVLARDVVIDQPFWTDLSTSLHFSQFDALMLALRDGGERFAFRNGADFKNGLVAWIPRAIYPGKETFHVGGWFRRNYQPEKINGWPVTTMGDWYLNFGYWGILLGAVVSGLAAAFFDAGYRHVRDSHWEAVVAPAVGLLIFDAGLDPGFVQRTILVLVPIAILAAALNVAERMHVNRRRRHLRTDTRLSSRFVD